MTAGSRMPALAATRLVRLGRPLVVVGLLLLLLPYGVGPAKATSGELRERGILPYGYDVGGGNPNPPGLVVDSTLHRGYIVDTNHFPMTIRVYDLENLRLEKVIELDPASGFNNSQRPFATVDTRRHRVFFTGSPDAGKAPTACDITPLWILDEQTLSFTRTSLPCLGDPASMSLVIDTIYYDEPSDKLYALGIPGPVYAPFDVNSVPYPKQPTVIAQFNAGTLTYDWSVDASKECDYHQLPAGRTFLARTADTVVAYCLQGGFFKNAGAARGAVMSVLVRNDRPVPDPETQQLVRIGTTYVDANVIPLADRPSNRVMLVSRDLPFGPGMWVFDAVHNAFLGVLPTGVDPNSLEGLGYGVDERTGRIYLHSSRGFVLADVRHTPLPGGVSYPAGVFKVDPKWPSMRISVDDSLGRVFLPVPERGGWLVFDDHVPPPPPAPVIDVDAGTADIPEVSGKTDRTYSSAANAFGVHLLSVGGIPSALEAALNRGDCAVQRDASGRRGCPSEEAFSPGAREYFLSEAKLDLGSQAGTASFATAGRAAPRDFATNADIRAAGACYGDRISQMHPELGAPFREHCPDEVPWAEQAKGTPLEGFTFANFKQGTQGPNGGGYPIPGSLCNDFGGSPTRAETAKPSPVVGSSSVECDAAKPLTTASGTAGSVSLPELGGLGAVSVAESFVRLETRLDRDKGVVSTATATVRGVSFGAAASIDEITTVATTSARGRSKSALADVTRTISGVRAGSYTCTNNCEINQVAAALNLVLGTKISVRVPRASVVETPKGFTALVSKDPSLYASDNAINDDTTNTFNGLDVIVYNDYDSGNGLDGQRNAGRSRLLLGLAGVQAEAHYGVFPLPHQQPGELGGGASLPGIDSLIDSGIDGLAPAYTPGAPSATPPSVTLPGGDGSGFGSSPLDVLAAAIRVFINSPRAAGLLAVLLGILATPIYLSIRRRALLDAVQNI